MSGTRSWETKLAEAKALAQRATQLELDRSYSSALQTYYDAGEKFIWLLSHIAERNGGSNTAIKDQLIATLRKLLDRAELIKKTRRDILAPKRDGHSEEFQAAVLDKSSVVRKRSFPLWGQPAPSFVLSSLSVALDYDAQPQLAQEQIRRGAVYKLGPEPLALPSKGETRPEAIVQDAVSDCSVVVAMQALAVFDRRFGTDELTKPFDGAAGAAQVGSQQLRFHFNGADRRVAVDELLPTDDEENLVCAKLIGSRKSWPGIIEKAYLTVMSGSYEFTGSNPSIDLHILAGWIPEHVHLRGGPSGTFQREKEWERIHAAWAGGRCLLSAGTAASTTPHSEPNDVQLVSSHAYCVLDMYVNQDAQRRIVLLNPWDMETNQERGGGAARVVTLPWDQFCIRFDSIFLSWSPTRWRHQITSHMRWSKSANASRTSNVSFILTSKPDGPEAPADSDLHVLLVRHFADAPSIDKHLGLQVSSGGARVSRSAASSMWFGGTHLLHRVKPSASEGSNGEQVYRIQASCMNAEGDAFTLCCFSNHWLSLVGEPETLEYSASITDMWSGQTAGGSNLNASFLFNPQYLLSVQSPNSTARSKLKVWLECQDKELRIAVHVVWGSGKRVTELNQGDVVASSGLYSSHLAATEADDLRNGEYTLVASAFDLGQEGEFTLHVECTAPVKIAALPPEGSGMYSRVVRGAWIPSTSAAGSPSHGDYTSNPTFKLEVPATGAFLARLQVESNQAPSLPAINLSVFRKNDGLAPLGRQVATSGPYDDSLAGVVVENPRLEAGGYLLLASTFAPNVPARFVLYVYTQHKPALQALQI